MKQPISVEDLFTIVVREERAASSAHSPEARKIHLDLARMFREKAVEHQLVVGLAATPTG